MCAEGAHSHLAETQWLHLSLKVNTHRGGPQIRPFQMPRPLRLSILCDNEQIPIQKQLPRDNVALCCLRRTWVNEPTAPPFSQSPQSDTSGLMDAVAPDPVWHGSNRLRKFIFIESPFIQIPSISRRSTSFPPFACISYFRCLFTAFFVYLKIGCKSSPLPTCGVQVYASYRQFFILYLNEFAVFI